MAKSKPKRLADRSLTRVEAESCLGEIGILQRSVAAIELRMNDELARVKERYEQEAQPVSDAIASRFEELHAWAEAHRDELLGDGDGKTVKLATGQLEWRLSPPQVRITGADVVVATLKRLGLGRFVRTKEEPNKQAILNEPEAVKGVKGISFSQREQFVAKPFESEIETVAPTKARSREIA